MSNFEDLIIRDTRANQPAAGVPGRIYYVTDEGVWERDNGSTWQDVTASFSGIDPTAFHSDVSGEFDGLPETTSPSSGVKYLIEDSYGAKGFVDNDNLPSGGGGGSGQTLISEQTPSGVSLVTFSSISGSYKTLEINWVARSTEISNFSDIGIQFNGDTVAANYRYTRNGAYGNGSASLAGGDNNYIVRCAANSSPTNSSGRGRIFIPFYALTTFYKQAQGTHNYRHDSSSLQEVVSINGVEWENTAAITDIVLQLAGGNFVSGSTFRLYGVK